MGLRKWQRQGGGRFVDLPEKLGAVLHYDPAIAANVDIGTGVSDFRPVVGSPTLDVVSMATPAKQPVYNTPSPTFASGRNTITYDNVAASQLLGSAQASVNFLNGALSPYTLFQNVAYVDNNVGGSFSVLQNNAATLNQIHAYNTAGQAGRTAGRLRDAFNFRQVQMTAGDLLANGVPSWVVTGYDGIDVLSIQTSAGPENTLAGCAVLAPVGIDQVAMGGYAGVGYYAGELGDWVLFDRWLNAADRAAMIAWCEGRL